MRVLYALIALVTTSVFGQDFAPFNGDVPKRFFETENSNQHDYYFYPRNTEITGSSIVFHQYFRRTYNEVLIGPDCIGWGVDFGYGSDTTWLGRTIIYDFDEKMLYLNNAGGDELSFDFSLDIGDSAEFYLDDFNTYYIKHTAVGTETIYGVDDVVKTYKILHYDSEDEVVISDLHLFEIKLGETLGLIRFINCKDFPFSESGLALMGQLHPTIGKYQMTYDEAFPWNVGDVLQYKSVYSSPEWNLYNTTFQEFTITDRVETADSVFIYHTTNSFSIYSPGEEYNTTTASIGYANPIRFKKGENIIENPSGMMPYVDDYQWTDSADFCGKRERIRIRPDWMSYCDSCQCDIFQDGFGMTLFHMDYTAGLGKALAYTEEYGGPPYESRSSEIIYSKVGGIECGNQAFSGVAEEELVLEIYPNPVADQLKILTALPVQKLYVRDLNGRLILSNNMNESVIEIDVSTLPKGMYVIDLVSNKTHYFKKFVVE